MGPPSPFIRHWKFATREQSTRNPDEDVIVGLSYFRSFEHPDGAIGDGEPTEILHQAVLELRDVLGTPSNFLAVSKSDHQGTVPESVSRRKLMLGSS
jgi:hypothetical protein